MIVVKTIAEMRAIIDKHKKNGKKIGFVPTMGYLHEGHLYLIDEAAKHADIIVMSIFVNPAQFGPNEDFDRYPRDFERDEALAKERGCDIMFYPDVKEIYPEGYQTYVEVEELQKPLCGAKRPGHFKGVATVVLKLFNIVKPDIAVFGMKDAQQVRVIERMTEDLNVDVKIIRGDIIREEDGLAKSSRNKYLSAEERAQALVLRKSLLAAKQIYDGGEKSLKKIRENVKEYIEKNSAIARIDYVEAVSYSDLKEKEFVEGETLIAVAAFFGATRLIDNIII